MKNTLVVNLLGAPSTGKSTLMAEIFAKLKWIKIDCEMVTEFAKELVWENRGDTFKDELYIFAKQNHRLFRVNGKVDVIITDRPLLLTIPYNRRYGDAGLFHYNKAVENMVLETHKQYNNLTFWLNRTKSYNPNGRNQTEEESNQLAIEFQNMLDEFKVPYNELDADLETADTIIGLIMAKIDIFNVGDKVKIENYKTFLYGTLMSEYEKLGYIMIKDKFDSGYMSLAYDGMYINCHKSRLRPY